LFFLLIFSFPLLFTVFSSFYRTLLLLINDFFDKKLNVKKRDINIPLDSNKIVTLVGVRRSGKTYILYDLINELCKINFKMSNILFGWW